LLARDGDADAADSVVFGGELERLAPAAADVEHAHAGAQTQLPADEIELGFLRIVEVARFAPVAATVDEALAQHRAEQVVAEIVVELADRKRAPPALQVHELRAQEQGGLVERRDLLVEARIEQAEQEAVEVVGVPPAV